MTHNDIYIWLSYGASFIVLAGLFGVSLRAKKKDAAMLHTLETHMRELSEKQDK